MITNLFNRLAISHAALLLVAGLVFNSAEAVPPIGPPTDRPTIAGQITFENAREVPTRFFARTCSEVAIGVFENTPTEHPIAVVPTRVEGGKCKYVVQAPVNKPVTVQVQVNAKAQACPSGYSGPFVKPVPDSSLVFGPNTMHVSEHVEHDFSVSAIACDPPRPPPR